MCRVRIYVALIRLLCKGFSQGCVRTLHKGCIVVAQGFFVYGIDEVSNLASEGLTRHPTPQAQPSKPVNPAATDCNTEG